MAKDGTAKDEWRVFEMAELQERAQAQTSPYLEFLRVPALSSGIYRLAVGSKDLQGPHDEDEMYLVVDGKARVRIGGSERSVGRGSILYIPATESHSFFEIEEDMTLLVFFASGGPDLPK